VSGFFISGEGMERAIRGIRILRRKENRIRSIKLLSINNRHYAVVIWVGFLGVTLYKKRYEFDKPDEAHHYYESALVRHFGKPQPEDSRLWLF